MIDINKILPNRIDADKACWGISQDISYLTIFRDESNYWFVKYQGEFFSPYCEKGKDLVETMVKLRQRILDDKLLGRSNYIKELFQKYD